MQMMHPGDSLNAAPSFTARRSAASSLPNVELPPPLSHMQNKYPSYSMNTSQAPSANSITSVGNLLTPPNTLPSESMTGAGNGANSNSGMNPYGSHNYWQQSAPSGPQYGYSGSNQQWGPPSRNLFSPTSSLNTIVRNGANTPSSSDVVSPNGYEMNQLPPFPTSMSMSAPPSLPTMHSQGSMHGSISGPSHPSPVNDQQSYGRPPPTPTYYNQQQSNSASSQHSFQYPAGPTPLQSTPRSMSDSRQRVSPPTNNSHNTHSPQSEYPRSYGQYPHQSMAGGVMSNMHSSSDQMALVGGMPNTMMGSSYGNAPQNMQHMYGAVQQQPPPPSSAVAQQNDRPFKCDQCVQSFNRNHDLKRHKRIHLAVKPYPCGHCDKSFSRKDALKRHILVKGCGKTSRGSDKAEDTVSPVPKVEAIAGMNPPHANRIAKVEA